MCLKFFFCMCVYAHAHTCVYMCLQVCVLYARVHLNLEANTRCPPQSLTFLTTLGRASH